MGTAAELRKQLMDQLSRSQPLAAAVAAATGWKVGSMAPMSSDTGTTFEAWMQAGGPKGLLGQVQLPGMGKAAASPISKEARLQQWVRTNQNGNTRRTYDAGWRGFQRYLLEEGKAESDIQPSDIADYLRVRVEEQGVAAATVAGDRSAIGDALKSTPQRGMHQHPLVKETLNVCMRLAAQSKPKQHVSAELMRAVVELHDARPAAAGVDWLSERNVCLLMVMMCGMLRQSEAVELRMEDVRLKLAPAMLGAPAVVESVELLIRHSKTDQRKKGATVLLAANPGDPSMCPVRRLERYIQLRAQAGVATEFLFPKKDGAGMAKSTPCGIVQDAVRAANAHAARVEAVEEKWGSPEAYGSHSMRRGGVTEARASGVEMLEIQRHGRWSSAAVWGYVGPTSEQRLHVTRNLFGGAAGSASGAASAPSSPLKARMMAELPALSPFKSGPAARRPAFVKPAGYPIGPGGMFRVPASSSVQATNSPLAAQPAQAAAVEAMIQNLGQAVTSSASPGEVLRVLLSAKPSPGKRKRRQSAAADSDVEAEAGPGMAAADEEALLDAQQMEAWQGEEVDPTAVQQQATAARKRSRRSTKDVPPRASKATRGSGDGAEPQPEVVSAEARSQAAELQFPASARRKASQVASERLKGVR
jgi:site-specific recombinase XerD